jgi:hypothetical protein
MSLQGTDEKSFDQILKTVHWNIKKLSESINFKEYETPIETGFSLVLDGFELVEKKVSSF